MTHICTSKLTIIGSDNGLSPGRRQAIIWTNAEILLIPTLGTNFSEILGEINSFSFSKMHLKMWSKKWRLFGLGLNELTDNHTGNCLCQPFSHASHLDSYLSQTWWEWMFFIRHHQFSISSSKLWKHQLTDAIPAEYPFPHLHEVNT